MDKIMKQYLKTTKMLSHGLHYNKTISKKNDSKSDVFICLYDKESTGEFPDEQLVSAEILTNTAGSDDYYELEAKKQYKIFDHPSVYVFVHATTKLLKVVTYQCETEIVKKLLSFFKDKKLKFFFYGKSNNKGELIGKGGNFTASDIKTCKGNAAWKLNIVTGYATIFAKAYGGGKKVVRPFNQVKYLNRTAEFMEKNWKVNDGKFLGDANKVLGEFGKDKLNIQLEEFARKFSFGEIIKFFKSEKNINLGPKKKEELKKFFTMPSGVLVVGVRGDCNIVKFNNRINIIDIGYRNIGFFKILAYYFLHFYFNKKNTEEWVSFISHFHPDHITGYRKVRMLKNYLSTTNGVFTDANKQKQIVALLGNIVDTIYCKKDTKKGQFYASWLNPGGSYKLQNIDVGFHIQHGIRIENTKTDVDDENDNSLFFDFGGKICVAGDLSIKFIPQILTLLYGSGKKHFKFMVVPHHGSTNNWKLPGKGLQWDFLVNNFTADQYVVNCFGLTKEARKRRSETVQKIYVRRCRKFGGKISVLEKRHLTGLDQQYVNDIGEYHTYSFGYWNV